MGPHAMHTPRKRGDDRDEILDQLLLHRAGRLLVDRRDLGAVALKVPREIRKAKARETIGIRNDDSTHFLLLNEVAQLL